MAEPVALKDQSRWAAKVGSLSIQSRHLELIEAACIQPAMRVLDLASGRGETAVLAAVAGAQVHATDVSASLVQTTLQNAGLAGVRITASIADMRTLEGIDPGFDVILGCAALHHLDEGGCKEAVAAAIRLLAPGGRALFFEPVENVPWFDFIKHCVAGPKGRPSILNRRAWRRWVAARDDRWMSDSELLSLWPKARIVRRSGLLRRVGNHPMIERVDAWLLSHKPIEPFAQSVIVMYEP